MFFEPRGRSLHRARRCSCRFPQANGNRIGLYRETSVVSLDCKHEYGGTDMGDQGKKDKGRRESQKQAKLTPKEKRKLKREKKK